MRILCGRASLALMAAVGSVALAGMAGPARALVIIPVYDSVLPGSATGTRTVAGDANAAALEATINADIAVLESYISNNVTLTVTFQELPLGNDGLADSNGNFGFVNYSDYRTSLATHQTLSAVDALALASLPIQGTNPVNPNVQVNGRTSILTALNPTGGYDLTGNVVEFNPETTFASRSSPVTGKYDFQSAILHELVETLGAGGPGSNLGNVATNFGGDSTLNGTNEDSAPGLLDLFRYSGAGVRSYSTSSTAVSYFSVDGGLTDLVHFNQAGNGDSDYADWGNGNITGDQDGNTPDQVQDAYSSAAYEGDISIYPNLGVNELTALDAIGWDLTPAGLLAEAGVPAPEPASLGMLVLGGIGLLARRRRAAR